MGLQNYRPPNLPLSQSQQKMRLHQGLDVCLAFYHETQAQLRVGHAGVGEVAGACGYTVWVFDLFLTVPPPVCVTGTCS
eukprot:CCRYP_008761-RA/>CCRYP_008761-RA protein AED:0.20 eAED:1.00 QI:0/-1/0/1/-1/0/1/0/78